MAEYGLLIKFTDSSPSFVYGFEAGYIWALIESGIKDFERTIHRSNIEVVKNMCINGGYIFEIKGFTDYEYANIFAIKSLIINN